MNAGSLARVTQIEAHEDSPLPVLRLFGRALPATEASEAERVAVPTARAHVYGPDTAGMFETASEIDYPSEGGTALQPQVREGWRTYNFEVEDLHTYIAGGLRVHNTSIVDIIPEGASNILFTDTDGDLKYDYATYDLPDGGKGTMQSRLDDDGNSYEVVRTSEIPRGDLLGQGDIVKWHERYEYGKLVQEEAVSIEYAKGSLQGEEIGRTLGSVLGSAIGTDSVFAQVGSATIAATLLQNVGEFLHKNADFSLLDTSTAQISPLEKAIGDTFNDLGTDLIGNLKIQVNNALSGIIIGELADVLNLEGFERGLFTTVGNTVTNQVLSNISIMAGPPSVIQANTNLLSGFEYSNMAANVANSLGGYFGSQLGNLAVEPKSPQSALFGSAAAAVGSYVATTAAAVAAIPLLGIPLVGPLIAAFAGQALGNLVGNALFDDDRNSHYTLFTDANGKVQFGYPYTQDGASLVLSEYMARTTRNAINSIFDSVGGQIDVSEKFNPFQMGWYVNNDNQKIMFAVNGTYQTSFNLQSTRGLISAAVNYAVANSEIIGGDILTRRAFDVSNEAGLAQLSFDLQVAKDFRKYLENTRLINTLIADSPQSEFSVGWIATLQRARELGLDKLADFNAMEYLAANDDLRQRFGTDTAAVEKYMLETGINEPGRKSFDAYQYIAANPDLAGMDRTAAALHYINHGRSQGRPTRFNTYAYLASYPDLWDKFGTNYRALYQHVAAVGLRPTIFDAASYLAANPDLRAAFGTDLEAAARHFVETGRYETFRQAAFFGGFDGRTVTGGAGSDTVSYMNASVAVFVDLPNQQASNGSGSDTLASIENVIGSNYADRLTGDWRNNIIEGRFGNDTLEGGAGVDTASYASTSGAAIVSLALQGQAQSTGDTGSDVLTGFENLIGGRVNDRLTGDAGNNTIEGGLGNDTLDGGVGIDTASYASTSGAAIVSLALQGQAQSTGDTGSDVLTGFENLIGGRHNDRLTGDAGNNTIEGGAGNDIIVGGAGYDTVEGGLGDDRLDGDMATYATAAAGVAVSLLLQGQAQNTGGAGVDTLFDFHDLTGSSFDDVFKGDANNNILRGGAGNDTIEGGIGDDRLEGGSGIDTASYAGTSGAAIVSLALQGQAQSTGDTGSDVLTGFENLIGGRNNDRLTGDAGNNTIEGGAGYDIIEGGLGDDRLDGDMASYATAAAGVRVDLTLQGQAQDTRAAGRDTLIDFHDVTGSSFDDFLKGDANNNILRGGAGNDTIEGGSGDDTLEGGAGIDRVSYANTSTAAIVSLALQGQVQNTGAGTSSDVLTGFENLIGGRYDDRLTGDAGNNTIEGGAGNDTIIGGAGYDTIEGGLGDDRLDGDMASYANAAAGVTIDLTLQGQAQDTRAAGRDTLFDFHDITGSAYVDVLTGDANFNIIRGGAGNDTIEGGFGNDTLEGGVGIDTVSYANTSGAAIVNLALQGQVQSTGDTGSDVLTGFENLIGGRNNDQLTGDAGNNTIEGGAGNDTIVGGAGIDTASYASTSGAVIVSLALQGQAQNTGTGSDVLTGLENLIGGRYNDQLTGDAGNNVIDGNGGSDVIYGGGGVDTFVFQSISGNNKIMDFAAGSSSTGEILRINRGLFANDNPLAAAADVGGNVVLTTANQSSITLVGVRKADLASSNFQII